MLTSWTRQYCWLVALMIAIAVSAGSAKAPVPDLNLPRYLTSCRTKSIGFMRRTDQIRQSWPATHRSPECISSLTRWTRASYEPSALSSERSLHHTVISELGGWARARNTIRTARSLCRQAPWSPILASRFIMTAQRTPTSRS